MSNLFKSVRIIHSPLDKRYYLEQRKLWRLTWQRVDTFEYVDEIRCRPYPEYLQHEALQRAKDKAALLLSQVVVWEKTNYFCE